MLEEYAQCSYQVRGKVVNGKAVSSIIFLTIIVFHYRLALRKQ